VICGCWFLPETGNASRATQLESGSQQWRKHVKCEHGRLYGSIEWQCIHG
jgi:hypothetical protein